jgi:hypothetical protein
MTTLFAHDGTGRCLVEADDHDGPDVLFIREPPDPLFGPKRANRKSVAGRRRFRGHTERAT